MNHEIIGEPISIGAQIHEITVKLIPENVSERNAIRNVEIAKAKNEERELINNYLLFGINGWSTLSIKSQIGTIFKLKATHL